MNFALVAQTTEENEADEDPPTVNEQIVVSAARTPVPLVEAVPSVAVIEEETIRSSAALTSGDLLRDVVGFSLLRADSSLAAHPTTQSVTLRGVGGTGASRALVLLDGVPLNDAYASWVSWNMVPTAALERIEVSKGAGSAVWGNLALGGVIHLTTRDDEGPRFDLTAKSGEDGLLEIDASGAATLGSTSAGAWRLSAHGGFLDFDGYSNIDPRIRGPVDISLFTEAKTAQLSLRGDVATGRQLSFRLQGLDEERGSGTAISGNATERLIGSVSYEAVTDSGSWAVRVHGQESTFRNVISTVNADRTSESLAVDQFDIPASAYGASLTWSGDVGRHTPSFGFDAQLTDGENNEDFLLIQNRLTRRRVAGGEQRLAGLFAGDRFRLGDRVEVELVARLDRWEKQDGTRTIFDLRTSPITTLSEEIFEDGEETQLSPRLGLVASLRDDLTLRASVYRGFRAPTVNELYKPFRLPGNIVTESNPDLVPEELLGAELGLELVTPKMFARIAGFFSEIEDPVINRTIRVVDNSGFVAPCGFVPGPGACRQRQNVGTQRSFGLDAELRGNWGRHWGWGVQALLMDLEVNEAPPETGLQGLEPPLIPGESLNASLEWRGSRLFDAALRLRYLGERFADDRNTFPLETQTLVDLQLQKRFGGRSTLFLGVQNLFDEESVIDESAALVRIGPPRLAHLGVRLHWGKR